MASIPCPACGLALDQTALRCRSCGFRPVERTTSCPACGGRTPIDYPDCLHCSNPLDQPAPAVAAGETRAAHTPDVEESPGELPPWLLETEVRPGTPSAAPLDSRPQPPASGPPAVEEVPVELPEWLLRVEPSPLLATVESFLASAATPRPPEPELPGWLGPRDDPREESPAVERPKKRSARIKVDRRIDAGSDHNAKPSWHDDYPPPVRVQSEPARPPELRPGPAPALENAPGAVAPAATMEPLPGAPSAPAPVIALDIPHVEVVQAHAAPIEAVPFVAPAPTPRKAKTSPVKPAAAMQPAPREKRQLKAPAGRRLRLSTPRRGWPRAVLAATNLLFVLLAGIWPVEPTEYLPSPDVARAYGVVNRVPAGSAALVVIEYSEQSRSRVEPAARAILEQLRKRGINLVIASTSAPALARGRGIAGAFSELGQIDPAKGDIPRLGQRQPGSRLPSHAALLKASGGKPVELLLVVADNAESAGRWLNDFRKTASPPGIAILAGGDSFALSPLVKTGQVGGILIGKVDAAGYQTLAGAGIARQQIGGSADGVLLTLGALAVLYELAWWRREGPRLAIPRRRDEVVVAIPA